ncbi:dihydroorotase [Limibacter armeniacum]|uniref:dihydroorotase n=1 Tax=Limibacter armeniacum TaxID=466084 RepID=UPI002FE606AA
MNEVLLKGIKVVSPNTPFHNKQVNILIKNGVIEQITEHEAAEAAHTINAEGLSVSAGWFDLRASLTEPGFEFKDDVNSLSRSAAFGGFTDLAVLPNTYPALETKESVEFVKARSFFQPVNMHVIAAMTKSCKGEEMTEMTDLYHAGAVAFSDGTHSSWNLGVLKRALMYVQAFDGLIIDLPEEPTMTEGGHMHEGITSTLMGTRGIPSIAEEIAIERSVSILRYTGGQMHFSNISTAKAVDIIRKAKEEGLSVTCDVNAHHLYFKDTDLSDFDTNLKVKPPFRGESDVQALWNGIQDGTIDAITSSHLPQDQESKDLEFDLSDFGMLGLETAFAALVSKKPDSVSIDVIIEKLTEGPRKVLKLQQPVIEEGAKACLTIFDEHADWTFTEKDIKSKSKNTPFIGVSLKGKALGIFNKDQAVLQDELKNR